MQINRCEDTAEPVADAIAAPDERLFV